MHHFTAAINNVCRLPRVVSVWHSHAFNSAYDDHQVDEVTAVGVTVSDTGETISTYHEACVLETNTNSSADYVFFVLYLWEVALLAWGVYLSLRTRKVNTAFSESTYISVAIYQTTAVTVLALAVTIGLGRQDPDFTYAGFIALSPHTHRHRHT